MPEYTYEALDKSGRQVKGIIEASSEEVIIEKLRNMGYYPLSVKLHKGKATQVDILALPGLRNIFHRIKRKHVTTFTRQLATLIDAGLPIMRSLKILEEQVESVVFKDKIAQIARDIESGSTLSDALAKHPKVFDSLYVNMVRAGEMGGVLEAILNKIADFLEKRQAIMGKIRSAMMYPVIVSVLATGIVAFILLFIMPKFKEIFDQLGAELPWLTQVLIDASFILANYWYWVIACLIVIYFILKKINQTREGKYVFDVIKLKLPVFGELFRKTAIVRFAGTLATLITSGVPILQALDIVRETSGNEVVTRAMDEVYESVKEGETIHEPLSRCPVFPPLVVHMVAVGEETGAIDQMLNKVAEAYEREVDDMVNAMASLLEPLMIVFLGVIVGVIVVALYLPLFTLPKVVGKD
ncbi:Type IV fimbrial assembly protein PilC [Candidatus Sumerlaea chitinivorans]|jgi:type IV pilus assembly protein PilC|uniref:Type IV fimbrial assembly protein PilC n=1 Tax=Sumerlaea chitinivorans TaxID=2250252 RepID=A0A2Z4Y3L2_SUMC1|nr:Type IV fimbrial assembly protein PilC [Candidatus Sumerlaea chitinivorans]